MAQAHEQVRALLRGLVRVCGTDLLLFCLVDDHLHVVVDSDHPGRRSAAEQRMLRARVEHALAPPHRRMVENRRHLRWLVRYVCTQVDHHALQGEHQALFEGSCLQDLCGARAIPGWDPARIWSLLPRDSARGLCAALDVPAPPPADARELAPAQVVRAALVAGASDLHGRMAHAVAVRLAVTHLLGPRPELQRLLGVGRRQLRWLAAQPADPALVRAVRVRLALEQAVLARATAA